MTTYRAEVAEVTDRGVFVRVRRSRIGGTIVGPCPTLVPNLEVGAVVIVAVLDERVEHYAVLGPIVPPLT